jgi:hypothetical protein
VATESDLRDLLRGPDPEGRGEIDLDAVLSRTRRRRRPRVIAAQALGSVALVGVLGTAIFVSDPLGARDVMMSAEEDSGAGADEIAGESATLEDGAATKWQPDACGAPLTEVGSSAGVTLEMELVTTFEPGQRAPVTVTLRNDGTERLVGTTASAPHVTLARDGVVVWHSYATQDASARLVDLEPGEQMAYETYIERAICGSEEDLLMDDPETDLPLAPAGEYEMRSVVVITADDGTTLLAVSPRMPLEITE